MSLRIVTTKNHREEDWPLVVKSIPKKWQSHRSVIRYFSQRSHSTVSRVLDVGAGEGTFIETVLEILLRSSCLTHNVHVDLIEQCPSHISILTAKMTVLKDRLAQKNIELTFKVFEKAIPLNHEEADRFFSKHVKGNVEAFGYDVIVASHISYYFPDGGAALLEALIDSALRTGGVAWFVIRSMKSSIYQVRSALLQEHSLPDAQAHQFAEYLTVVARCLYEDVFVTQRTLDLHFDALGKHYKKAIRYLTWLDRLDNDQAARLKKAKTFRESHLFIPHPKGRREHGDHEGMLAAAHAIASSINAIRCLYPNLIVIRATLASIFHSGTATTMIRYGFSHKQESHDEAKAYLIKNPSFLQYDEFFLDNAPVFTEGAASPYFVRSIGLTQSSTLLDDHVSSYSVHAGLREHYTFRETTKDLRILYDEWLRLLARMYGCGNRSKSGTALFSVDIGARIESFSDLPGTMAIDKSARNGACGLFMLLASKADLERLPHLFCGHIKITLLKYLAQLLLAENQELNARTQLDNERLTQIEQAMALMQIPLREITGSIHRVHVQTQYLRSVLYAPERTFFDAHTAVSPLFTQGQTVKLASSSVLIQHEPRGYPEDSGIPRILVLTILAVCYGIDRDRLGALAPKKFPDLTCSLIRAAERFQDPDDKLFDTFCFACGLDADTKEDGLRMLSTMDENKAIDSLENLKFALYTPFKIGERIWPFTPLALAFRSSARPDSPTDFLYRPEKLKKRGYLSFAHADYTPLPYSALLEFVMALCDLLNSKQRKGYLRSVTFVQSEDVEKQEVAIEIVFEQGSILNDEGRKRVRSLMHNHVLKAPRDWRIEDAHSGDTFTPWINLASKCIGIYDKRSRTGSWKSHLGKNVTSSCVLLLINTDIRRQFRIELSSDDDNDGIHITNLAIRFMPWGGTNV